MISAINAKIAVEKTRQPLQSHAQNADYAKFDTLLEKVPDVPPIEGDDSEVNRVLVHLVSEMLLMKALVTVQRPFHCYTELLS